MDVIYGRVDTVCTKIHGFDLDWRANTYFRKTITR